MADDYTRVRGKRKLFGVGAERGNLGEENGNSGGGAGIQVNNYNKNLAERAKTAILGKNRGSDRIKIHAAKYNISKDGFLTSSDDDSEWNYDGYKSYNYAHYNLYNVLGAEGITFDRAKSRELDINFFNKNKIMNPVDYVNFGRAYVFFTKPDLYLFTDKDAITINPSIVKNCPDLHMKIMQNPQVARSLQSIFSDEPVTASDKGFLHLLGSKCVSLSMVDVGLSSREGPRNAKNYGVKYGGDFFEALQSTEISLEFHDNRYRDVATMIEIWTMYIEGISQGKIFKKKRYRDMNTIDYAISIYTFILDETDNVLAHGAYIGCYPRNINTAILSYRRDSLDANHFLGPFSYTFQASHVAKPNAHSTIDMFNYVSGFKNLQLTADYQNAEKTKIANQWARQYAFPIIAPSMNHDGYRLGNKDKVLYIMHNSIQAMGGDIMRYDMVTTSGEKVNFSHQLSITEKWPQYVGVTMLPESGGTTQYRMVYYSTKNYLDSAVRPEHELNEKYPFVDFSDIVDMEYFNYETDDGKISNLYAEMLLWDMYTRVISDNRPVTLMGDGQILTSGRFAEYKLGGGKIPKTYYGAAPRPEIEVPKTKSDDDNKPEEKAPDRPKPAKEANDDFDKKRAEVEKEYKENLNDVFNLPNKPDDEIKLSKLLKDVNTVTDETNEHMSVYRQSLDKSLKSDGYNVTSMNDRLNEYLRLRTSAGDMKNTENYLAKSKSKLNTLANKPKYKGKTQVQNKVKETTKKIEKTQANQSEVKNKLQQMINKILNQKDNCALIFEHVVIQRNMSKANLDFFRKNCQSKYGVGISDKGHPYLTEGASGSGRTKPSNKPNKPKGNSNVRFERT